MENVRIQVGDFILTTTTKKTSVDFKHEKNAWKNAFNEADQGTLFNDGQRKIDMVLAYEDPDDHEDPEDLNIDPDQHKSRPASHVGQQELAYRRKARKIFERNLELSGLHLERESKMDAFDRKTSFVKIHVPKSVVDRNADILGLTAPVKEFMVTAYMSTSRNITEPVAHLSEIMRSFFDCDTIPPEPNIFSPGFLPDRTNKYIVKSHSNEFNNNQRSQVVWSILNRTRYKNECPEKVGIQRLIAKQVYKSAYPLHDGDYEYLDDDENSLKMNERRLLYLEWAKLRNWYKRQPLWLIKNYFGVKIGLYFAWLGFYTKMLIFPSIMGIICFIFGAATVHSSLNQASIEICGTKDNSTSSLVICPECDKFCGYSSVVNSCFLSRITYLFDNYSTVLWSIFMTVWATTYLEMWKRRQAILKWEWDLSDNEDVEEIRPEFESNVKSRRVNPVTKVMEAFVSGKERFLRITLTWAVVFFILGLVLTAVFSVIVFRMVLIRFMYQTTNESIKVAFFAKYAKLIGVGIAASLNALVIEIMGYFFQIISRKLTNFEHHRTQTDYENSYTFKMFLFQFMNYYSSLMYTAFFKGRFYTYPGDRESREGFASRLKGDQCDPAGCLADLCLMLAVYMIFRQIASNFVELLYPKLKNWWRYFVYKSHLGKNETPSEYQRHLKRWEHDYQLEEIDRLHLFDEYIEMIIQYGFVTIFVAAFPLAPLLALINNVFEIRLDAYKYTTQMRRPIAQQVKDIGIWYSILEGMTYLAVVFNALIIALTSDFIPRMVYLFVQSEDGSLKGFVNSTLAIFETSEFGNNTSEDYFGPQNVSEVVDVCRYRGYRSSPQDEVAYVINDKWIHVFTARLGFIVIFEHFVLVIKILLAYVIPDAPNNLSVQLQRERQNLREAQFQEEQNRPFTGPNYNHDYEPEDLEEETPEPSVLNSLSAGSSRRLNSVSPLDTTIITTLTKDKTQ